MNVINFKIRFIMRYARINEWKKELIYNFYQIWQTAVVLTMIFMIATFLIVFLFRISTHFYNYMLMRFSTRVFERNLMKFLAIFKLYLSAYYINAVVHLFLREQFHFFDISIIFCFVLRFETFIIDWCYVFQISNFSITFFILWKYS